MDTTKQTLIPAVPPRNGARSAQVAGALAAQGYTIGVVSRLEALIQAPDGSTSIFSATLEVITPENAALYLAKMRPNRHLGEARVATWARSMEADLWRPTNQGIGFDSDGYLIDGQHRLAAIVRSGKAAPMLVVRGLPTAVQNVVDSGRVRRAGDQFNITFSSRDGKQRVAVARVLHLLRSGWTNPTDAVTTEEAFRQIETYRREIEWAMSVFPSRRRIAPAPVAAAWAYAYASAPAVAQWADAYVEGAGLEKGDPLLLLRDYVAVAGAQGSSKLRMEMALKAARALWAKHSGTRITKLYATADGLLGFAKLRGDDIAEAWAGHSVR